MRVRPLRLAALGALALTAGVVPVSSAPAATPTCSRFVWNGSTMTKTTLAATIVAVPGQVTIGTTGDDVIVGTTGTDEIRAGGGNDTICTRGGSDLILTANGDDSIDLKSTLANARPTIVRTAAGNDVVRGGYAADTVNLGTGMDFFDDLGNSADTVYGGAGPDTIFGDAGNDLIDGGSGDDHLGGGAGDDIIQGDDGSDYMHGGDQYDICKGSRGEGDVADVSCEKFTGVP